MPCCDAQIDRSVAPNVAAIVNFHSTIRPAAKLGASLRAHCDSYVGTLYRFSFNNYCGGRDYRNCRPALLTTSTERRQSRRTSLIFTVQLSAKTTKFDASYNGRNRKVSPREVPDSVEIDPIMYRKSNRKSIACLLYTSPSPRD